MSECPRFPAQLERIYVHELPAAGRRISKVNYPMGTVSLAYKNSGDFIKVQGSAVDWFNDRDSLARTLGFAYSTFEDFVASARYWQRRYSLLPTLHQRITKLCFNATLQRFSLAMTNADFFCSSGGGRSGLTTVITTSTFAASPFARDF